VSGVPLQVGADAPFPWFGGKRRVAPVVWRALGDVSGYVEPFAGSLAVLLRRPGGAHGVETVNDKDCYLANFWRAVQRAPDEVAYHADSPVNECVPAGTMIATPGGDISVEDVRPGTVVWGERNGSVVPTEVRAVHSSGAADFVALGSLRLTANHPVWTTEGYTQAGALAPGMRAGVLLAGERDRPTVGCVRIDGPSHEEHPVRRRDLAEASARRTHFPRAQDGENPSGLLDSQPARARFEARVDDFGKRTRRRVARRGARMDRKPSRSWKSPYESDGRRRRDSGQEPVRRAAVGTLQANEGANFTGVAESGDVGMAPLGSGEDGYREGVYRTPTFRRGEGSDLGSSEGSGYDCLRPAVGEGSNRRATNGGTQDEDRRRNDEPEARAVRGNGASVPFDHERRASARSERGIGEPVSEEGLPLQRESLPLPVAVYNFQTDTGNYFAAGILVHNCDLFARHLWLVNTGRERIVALESDPDHFDAKVAGWWVWGVCSWIGSGWCSGKGPWQLPHLGNPGQGVNRQLPHLGDPGRGYVRTEAVYEWMNGLAARLRRVRVACGDWSRVVTPSVIRAGSYPCGVFLDPPYDTGSENYSVTEEGIAAKVREWALDHGEDERLRIILCGYEGEHEMPDSWHCHAYSATGAYAGRGTKANENRHRERLWFSPHCLRQPSLFDFPEVEADPPSQDPNHPNLEAARRRRKTP